MADLSAGSSTLSTPRVESRFNPALQRALGSLMLNLDDELLRYRQTASGQAGHPSLTPLQFRPKPTRSPSLINLKPPTPSPRGQTSPQRSSVAPPPPPNPWTSSATPPAVSSAATAPSPTALKTGAALMPYAAMPQDYLESSEALLGSTPLPPPLHRGDEELDYQPSMAQQLATPLGLGALLLLLAGSAGFGYLVTSPEAIQHLRDHALIQRLRSKPAADQPLAQDAEPHGAVAPGLQGIGPDLSAQEFGSLDLDRISNLPSDSTSGSAQNFPPLSEDSPNRQGGSLSRDRPTEPSRAMRAETVAPLPSSQLPSPTVAPVRPSPAPTRPAPAAAPPSPP
ncbi:MAG TPA: hypothetical protein IGR64_11070, partial [Leptolyngbyaceae cyanobacterium M65_K2018_010]|nr:hypothetical protein [Leptolyngbyaceae cyanobacterium M65_K2018_010]